MSYLLYTLVVIGSAAIRQFVLPNPFACFGDYAMIINGVATFLIAGIAYAIVGRIYRKGSAPVLGSILYLLTYAAITGILLLMSIFKFAWWWVLVMLVACAALILGIRVLAFKITGDDVF